MLHKTWRCQKCNQKFVSLEYLKEHRQTHRTKCDLCEKTFRYKSNFNFHMYTHNNPPNCDVCTKSFANYSRLAEHKIIHTDEKPFKCESCPKSFNNGGSLSRHRRQHDPDKKQCEQCAGGFNSTEQNISTTPVLFIDIKICTIPKLYRILGSWVHELKESLYLHIYICIYAFACIWR